MRICHHHPDHRPPLPTETEAEIAHVRRLDEEYRDTDTPAIHVCGRRDVCRILEDHPEIRFLASVYRSDDIDRWHEEFRAAGPSDLKIGHFEMTDSDQRACMGYPEPNANTVGAMIDFFREWLDAAPEGGEPPSMIVHCAAGQYRSAAGALVARTMLTGDPLDSAKALVTASRDIDSNWEIARHADDLLRMDGALHRVAVNVEEAVFKLHHMMGLDRPGNEIAAAVDAVLLQPVAVECERSADWPRITRAYHPDTVEDGLPGKAMLVVKTANGRPGGQWSGWLEFPGARDCDYLAAPVALGVYELRCASTRKPIACGWSRNVASDLAALAPSPDGTDGADRSPLQKHLDENHVLYRCKALWRGEERQAEWEVEELKAENEYLFSGNDPQGPS